MKTITFKQEFTFPEESVKGFALFLGWIEKFTRSIAIVDENGVDTGNFEIEEYDNPETYIQYVERLSIEHTQKFTKAWAEKLKEDYLNTQVESFKEQTEPALYEQIIKPVEDALISEVIENTI